MIEIVADPSSLERSSSGAISGRLSLRGAAASFPEENWSDMPVVVLERWIDGLCQLAAAERSSFEGLFMEGPFAFTVSNAATVGFVEVVWGKRGQGQPVGTVKLGSLLQSAVIAGAAVAQVCQARHWQSRDVELLEKALARAAA